MENSNRLISSFQECCKLYFVKEFRANIFLYIDIIPHDYLGTDFTIDVINSNFEWLNQGDLKFETYTEQDQHHGKQISRFKQQCTVTYIIKINDLIIPQKQVKHISFFAESFEPYKIVHPTILSDELIALDNFRKIKINIKERFSIKSISDVDTLFPGNKIGFSFYTGVIRKDRIVKPLYEKIAHGYVYHEVSDCHDEIQECLLNALFHERYISNLMGREILDDGKPFYMPNLSYNDFQYLIWVSFGLDRLYSFWDRIIYVLANYEDLNFKNFKSISFNKYFVEMKKAIKTNKAIAFNKNSNNLAWIVKFHESHFPQITKYRHRIVHYTITENWEGVLSSKFRNNAMEYGANEVALKKLRLEFESLGNLLLQHFNYCREGFIKALNLIDELQ